MERTLNSLLTQDYGRIYSEILSTLQLGSGFHIPISKRLPSKDTLSGENQELLVFVIAVALRIII